MSKKDESGAAKAPRRGRRAPGIRGPATITELRQFVFEKIDEGREQWAAALAQGLGGARREGILEHFDFMREQLGEDLDELLDALGERPAVFARMNALDDLRALLEAMHLFGNTTGAADANDKTAREQRLNAMRRMERVTEAKRKKSRLTDDAIAALVAPLRAKHPTWTANRIADEIAPQLNRKLPRSLGHDAIRKRVKKYLDGPDGRSMVR